MIRNILLNKKGKQEKIISFLLTAIIILIIFIFGTVHAVNLYVHSASSTSPTVGNTIYFISELDILQSEGIPIQNLTLELNSTYNCTFYPNATEITGDACDSLNFSLLNLLGYFEETLWGYGYGYDGSSWGTANTTFGIGYGYGAVTGYNYTGTNYSELAYNVTWNTNSFATGTYNIYLYANVALGSHYFKYKSETPLNITVSTSSDSSGGGGGGGGGGGSDENETEDTNDPDETLILSGDVFFDEEYELANGEIVNITLDKENITLKVISLTQESAKVKIGEIIITLDISDSRDLDVNEDGKMDIIVQLKGISDGKATFSISEFKIDIRKPSNPLKRAFKTNIILAIVIIICIVGIVVVLTLRKKWLQKKAIRDIEIQKILKKLH